MTTFSASAERVDLQITSGDDETFSITKEDKDGNTEDITGWTFWLTIKTDQSDSDSDAVIQKNVTTHTDAVNGETNIELDATDTADLAGNYFYDMQFKTDAGDIKTFMYGNLNIQADITEAT